LRLSFQVGCKTNNAFGEPRQLTLSMHIAIEGMRSPACVERVRRALERVEGLQVREVNVGSAVVDGDAKLRAAALEAIEKAGFQPHISA
jgi:copper chaperone CopZ